jgi:hypothetical protein
VPGAGVGVGAWCSCCANAFIAASAQSTAAATVVLIRPIRDCLQLRGRAQSRSSPGCGCTDLSGREPPVAAVRVGRKGSQCTLMYSHQPALPRSARITVAGGLGIGGGRRRLKGKMPSTFRIASVALVLALVAGPAVALSAACCPETEAKAPESIGSVMPCCAEACAPAISGPTGATPAVAVPLSAFGAPLAVVMAATNSVDNRAVAGMPSVFPSSSLSPDSGRTSSVLRL